MGQVVAGEYEPDDPPKEFVLAVFEFLKELDYPHNCVAGTISVTKRGGRCGMTRIGFDGTLLIVQSHHSTGQYEDFELDLFEPDSLDKLEKILQELH